MPDLVVHNAMGDRVLGKLPEEIRKEIDGNAFHVGVLGPDPYFFYRFFAPMLRRGVDGRGAIMHHKMCGKFLIELGRRCCVPRHDACEHDQNPVHTSADANVRDINDDGQHAGGCEHDQNPAGAEQQFSEHDRDAFAYFCGFLCHYALDSTVHPYINMIAAKRDGMHTAVERKLDRIELRRQGRTCNDILKLLVPFPDIPEIRATMKAVYGWDDECFRAGYRHMKYFLWLVKDSYRWLEKMTGSKPAKPVLITPEEVKKIAAGDVESDYKKKIIKGPPLEIPRHGIPKLFAKIVGKKNYGRLAAFPYTNHFCDAIEMPDFDMLEEISEQYAVKLITAAYDYRAGRITESELAEIIGNRCYSGGTAED